MKISYVFPITSLKTDVKAFFEEFSKTKFFKKYKEDYELFFVVDKENPDAIKATKALIKNNKSIKLLELENIFNYGTAFKLCVPYIKGEVVLLGDVKYPDNAKVFEDMMIKHKEGADIVHVKERKQGFGAFVDKCCDKVYNMFVKMFTGKEDHRGLLSIGLLDDLVIDVLSELPEKANFLRNCKSLEGVVIDSVEIEPAAHKYKVDYAVKTFSLVASLVMAIVFIVSIGAIVAVNLIKPDSLIFINIVLAFLMVISLFSIFIMINKHILDVRNDNTSSKNAIVGKTNIK
jgi:hypothetical protein